MLKVIVVSHFYQQNGDDVYINISSLRGDYSEYPQHICFPVEINQVNLSFYGDIRKKSGYSWSIAIWILSLRCFDIEYMF